LVALSIPPLVAYYQAPIKEGEDWRGAVAYVVREQQQGDGIVFLSRYGRRPFEYYLDRSGAHDGIVPIYPGVAWGSYTPVLADLNIDSTSVAAERLQSYQRVWAILLWGGFENHHQEGGPLKVELEGTFDKAATHGSGEMLEVRLYRRGPPSPARGGADQAR
jgi:hypothetical protein